MITYFKIETMTNDLRNFIKEKCLASENYFQPVFYEKHLLVVEEYALKLADIYNADKEVVQAAALIHDIAAVTDFSKLANHAKEGAILAKAMLADYPFTSGQKEKVYHCIENHSQPIQIGADIPEAVCISNADAMSQIAEPFYWMFYAFSVRKFGFEEGYNWYKQRINTNWESIIPSAREIVNDRYLKIIQILENN